MPSDPDVSLGSQLPNHFVVVAYPHGDVNDACSGAQEELRRLAPGAQFPNLHLSLGTVAGDASEGHTMTCVERWAARTPCLKVSVDGGGAFGPPHRVLYASVQKTKELSAAYADFGDGLQLAQLRPAMGEGRPVAEWIPHISLVHVTADDHWRALADHRPQVPAAAEVVDVVTLVQVHRGHIGTFLLRG